MNDRIINKVLYLLGGISGFIYGTATIFERTHHSWKYGFIDYGEKHYLVGILFILFGIYTIYLFFKEKEEEKIDKK